MKYSCLNGFTVFWDTLYYIIHIHDAVIVSMIMLFCVETSQLFTYVGYEHIPAIASHYKVFCGVYQICLAPDGTLTFQ